MQWAKCPITACVYAMLAIAGFVRRHKCRFGLQAFNYLLHPQFPIVHYGSSHSHLTLVNSFLNSVSNSPVAST